MMRKNHQIAKLFAVAVLAAALTTGCGSKVKSVTDKFENSVIGEDSGSGKLVSLGKKSFGQGEFDKLLIRTDAMEIEIAENSGNFAEVELLVDDNIANQFTFDGDIRSRELNIDVKEKSKLSVKDQTGQRKLRISLPDKTYRQLTVRNAFGVVQASDVKAELIEVKVDAGAIRLNGVSGKMDLKTSAGEVTVEGIRLDYDLNAKADVGNVTVHLSESPSNAEVRLESEVGKAAADLERIEYSVNKSNKKVGTIGSGGVRLSVNSSVGEILVDVQS
ncbi:DUF4097 family beta strand repeat-containing protein [Cohnella terricola]|uniref:DUF4097 domain-containing protein n=1 Tax=Cohnella terricola TaxID=1289167 RepID=A0A559JMZ3_9BACL|nr:DUF4097 family beta strand repeat-containing protein [Cohnella terricola]TVY01242.1 DUF4097 domain-containing protein [Cohnella terricola]